MSKLAIVARGVGVQYSGTLTRDRSLYQAAGRLLRGPWRDRDSRFWALQDVSFEVADHELLGVIGANGSGKSTLLLALAGILRPEAGTIHTFGSTPRLLTRGGEFQPDLTGRQNVRLNAAYHGFPQEAISEQIEEIIEFSELGSFADVPVLKYSAGMRARLAFSILAHLEPEIVLLDDVLGAGDEHFRRKSRERFEALMAKARAIVVVGHNMRFMREACTRVLWLDHGRIVQMGDPEETVQAYVAHVRATEGNVPTPEPDDGDDDEGADLAIQREAAASEGSAAAAT